MMINLPLEKVAWSWPNEPRRAMLASSVVMTVVAVDDGDGCCSDVAIGMNSFSFRTLKLV